MKKFAFLAMVGGEAQEGEQKIRAKFVAGGIENYIVITHTYEEAYATARELMEEGVGCIELCGGFGPERARKVMEATENKVAIGYVTHFPEHDKLTNDFFSD